MEEIDKAIEILQAFKEGKALEYRIIYHESWSSWTGIPTHLFERGYEYRIKPEPTYRPYANAEEFLKASKEHGPYIKRMNSTTFRMPIFFDNDGIVFDFSDDNDHCTYEEILEWGIWQDGTPCSILEQ